MPTRQPRRMHALARLRELLGIAHQDKAPGGACHREHVGQRQLARLVDEQGVDAAGELLA